MVAREASLNDPEVVKILTSQFVPLALDNVANPNMTPAEQEFLKGFDSGIKGCTIGMSAFTADGRKLAAGGDFDPRGVERMLRKALAEFKPESVTYVPSKDGGGGVKTCPEGGLVLYVTWKILEPAAGTDKKVVRQALGSDRLWVRKDEVETLVSGRFPDSLKQRIRTHVGYVFGWDVKEIDLTLKSGRLTGGFANGDRGDALGFVDSKNGAITRFELLFKGLAKRVEDFGFSACLSVVPEGQRVSTALYLELADPREGLARIVPHRSKNGNYLR